MLVEERELISKLLRQSILTLCRETMSQYKLEVDGIVCISFENDSHPIIIKVHEQLQTDSGGSTLWALNNNKNDSLVTYNPYDVSGKKSSELKERLLNDSPRPRDFSVTDDDLDDNSFNDSSYSYKNFMKLGFLAATRGRLNSSLNDKKSKSNPLDSSLASSPDEYKSMSPPLGGVKCEDDDESAFQIPDDDSPFSTLPLPDVMPEAIPTVSRPGIPNTIHAQSAALTHPDGYVCRRCFQVLPDTSAFESHNLRVHTLFTCKICFRAFTARNNLKRHIRLHTGVKPYKCPICNQGFTRKDDLKGHELRHSFKKPFRCNICKKGYTDRSCVRNHMAKEHNMKLQHVCPRCGEGFSSSEKFTEHKKTHPEFKNYRCETCDFIGVNGLMHIKHQLTHEDKKYSCKPCNNTYDDPFKYSEHLKIHRVDESFKSYECCFCGSCQQTYDQFVRHEHSHAQFKNNTCTICSKSFMYPSSLKDHMATHNRAEEDESSDYYCNECQTGFPTLDSLEEHIVSTHESVDQMMDDSPYDDTVNDSLSTSRQDSIEEAEQRTEHPPPEPDEPESDLNILKNSYITLQKPPSIIPMKNRSQGRTKSSKSPMGRFSPLSLKSALSSTEKHSPSTKTPDAFASMILAPFPQDFSLEESMKTYASADDSNPGVNNGSLPDRNPSIKLEPGSYENGSEDPSIISGHTNEGGDASDNRDMMVLEKVQIRPPGFERVFTPSLLFKCHSSFQCIECSKVFTDFNQFESHSAILHRRFLCEFCGKVFTAKPNRDRHLRYHTGERPYKCGLCDASFFRGDDLKYHRTTKHASEKPFVCDVCGLNFAWPKDLQRHRKQKKHFKI